MRKPFIGGNWKMNLEAAAICLACLLVPFAPGCATSRAAAGSPVPDRIAWRDCYDFRGRVSGVREGAKWDQKPPQSGYIFAFQPSRIDVVTESFVARGISMVDYHHDLMVLLWIESDARTERAKTAAWTARAYLCWLAMSNKTMTAAQEQAQTEELFAQILNGDMTNKQVLAGSIGFDFRGDLLNAVVLDVQSLSPTPGSLIEPEREVALRGRFVGYDYKTPWYLRHKGPARDQ